MSLIFNEAALTFCSHKFRPQIDQVYKALFEIFQNPDPSIDQIDRALEVMEVIAPLSKEIATKSYGLFRVIMHAKALQSHPEKKLKASRLAMRGAYTWDDVVPPGGRPSRHSHSLGRSFQIGC